jgi:hypothetical protein
MTLLEIEHLLPSGFHDGYLSRLALDFACREAELSLDVLIGGDDQPAGDGYRKCRLIVHDYAFVILEPAIAYRQIGKPRGLGIDRTELRDEDRLAAERAGYEVPPRNFWLALFVYEWNSRIIINARDATLEFP